MNKNLEIFRELLLTDTEFQKKLQDALSSYTGEKTEEAVFNEVLVPFAAEYGITATFDELKKYMGSLSDAEMNKDELSQITGGTKGFGMATCSSVGFGLGGYGEDGEVNTICLIFGGGKNSALCAGSGIECI